MRGLLCVRSSRQRYRRERSQSPLYMDTSHAPYRERPQHRALRSANRSFVPHTMHRLPRLPKSCADQVRSSFPLHRPSQTSDAPARPPRPLDKARSAHSLAHRSLLSVALRYTPQAPAKKTPPRCTPTTLAETTALFHPSPSPLANLKTDA
jgi:hypothetical protein